MLLCMWLHDGAGRCDPFYGSSLAMSSNQELSCRIREQLPRAPWHFVHILTYCHNKSLLFYFHGTHLHITNVTVKILRKGGFLSAEKQWTPGVENESSLKGRPVKGPRTGTYDFALYEVTHDFIIEVFNGRPPYSLLNVFFLDDRN